ncbi:hypothetical protein [Longimicrobium sp.]|uniref:hypothetical protein n=1 Tax=Longimicrobium sp. TaxID=2029185 RepID=UPI002CD9BCF8|nr:hypothetical protein [Longimicrobium sp.]HSU15095.1 hypothetical protein [Longimicrobium sp.]
MKKLELSIDQLAVDSFPTEAAALEERGTVRGAAAPCTAFDSCYCNTSLYRCGTIRATYSCPATQICL